MTEPTAPAPEPPAAELKRTPLYPFHVAHHGRLVPFSGWEMPLYFAGILEEHHAVRNGVGLFDVGHMGIVTIRGEHAADLLSRRTTVNAAKILPGNCRYGFLPNADGAIVDDLIVTRLDANDPKRPEFLTVPNAGRAAKVVELLTEHRRPDTTVEVHNGPVTILAVQGPGSRALLEKIFGWSLAGLKFYTARLFPANPQSKVPKEGTIGPSFPASLKDGIHVSRTGYTGELGYELFVPAALAVPIAEKILAAGGVPCGLGARDTLRLEKGYLLSGQDFNLDRTPLEAGQEKFVDFDHPFVGHEVMEGQRKNGLKVRIAGITVKEAGAIPRHGTPVGAGDQVVAHATSGGLSPSLQYGVALAYLPLPLGEVGTKLWLDLRGKHVPAEVAALPFLPAGGGRKPT
ncbi:MAG TPA: glycine cleavage system aminomethyltransferase GcvT [Thermoplasmata archaeon]|nr:glycine cleavage system aminomethyltransferase GcvT [Thermoplasmata archaeon]